MKHILWNPSREVKTTTAIVNGHRIHERDVNIQHKRTRIVAKVELSEFCATKGGTLHVKKA